MKLVPSLFWILALVHMVPMIAAIMPSQITKLYGIVPAEKTQIVLLQHRRFYSVLWEWPALWRRIMTLFVGPL